MSTLYERDEASIAGIEKLRFFPLEVVSGHGSTLITPDGRELLAEVDLGDIVGATGRVGTTRKGELSIFVERLAMLTKALRPLPEKWHGLKDPELQQRQRSLHLATDPDARERLVDARADTLRAVRTYLDEHGYVEVETPVLQTIAGGAMARPFVTHHRDLDMDLYLRISLELHPKRLLVGGLERLPGREAVEREEGDGQHRHDDEHPFAHRLAQREAGDDQRARHFPPTTSR